MVIIFQVCSIIDHNYQILNPIKNWNVSNGNNFRSMFCGCSSLSDIKPLQNWNVSNGNNFGSMFSGCSSLTDIKGLEKWNVSNGNIFEGMFYGCSSLRRENIITKDWRIKNQPID